MIELTPEMKVLMEKMLPQLKELIFREIKGHNFDDGEKINFVLSCATNLLGNLVWHTSNDNLEELYRLSAITMRNLMAWFSNSIDYLSNKKDMH